MREAKLLLKEKSEKYRAPLIQTGPSYRPEPGWAEAVPAIRLAVSWPEGAWPGLAGQVKPLEVPDELELEELEEDELDELDDELELDELEDELELDELEVRPVLELLELLLDELVPPAPVTGSAPQAVRAAIEHAKRVLLSAEGIGIKDPQVY